MAIVMSLSDDGGDDENDQEHFSEAYSLAPIPPGSCPRIRPSVCRLQTLSQHGSSGPAADMD